MAKIDKNLIAGGLGILAIVGSGFAGEYAGAVLVIGGVLTGLSVNELIRKK